MTMKIVEVEADIGITTLHCIYDSTKREILEVAFNEGGTDISSELPDEVMHDIEHALMGMPTEELKPTVRGNVIKFPKVGV